LSGGTAVASYIYDLSGNITSCTRDNGTSTAFTVDQVNRETAVVHNLVGGTKRFDYAYNNVSDITAVQRDLGLGDGYAYDLTQQILGYQQNGTVNLGNGTITNPQTNTNLTFDGCGNRTSLNGINLATPNNMNQPTDAGIYYDAQGNLQILSGWNYMYDAQNRLTAASDGVSSISFYYDGKNRQVARAINGAIRFSVWDDWELLEEYTMGNVRTAAYLQGAHGPVKSLLNNVYYYQDSLGSTSHIASSAGALLEYYKYDLNGKPTYWSATGNQLSVSSINDLFAGERYIPELGLYDDRNRFYFPDLARFLQPDPIGFKGDGSNLYRYCGNDWANRVDPLGLDYGPFGSFDAALAFAQQQFHTEARQNNTEFAQDVYKFEKTKHYYVNDPNWGSENTVHSSGKIPNGATNAGHIHDHGHYAKRQGNHLVPTTREQDTQSSDKPSTIDRNNWNKAGHGKKDWHGGLIGPSGQLTTVDQKGKEREVNGPRAREGDASRYRDIPASQIEKAEKSNEPPPLGGSDPVENKKPQ
jgi:RHS repeat-associated protein